MIETIGQVVYTLQVVGAVLLPLGFAVLFFMVGIQASKERDYRSAFLLMFFSFLTGSVFVNVLIAVIKEVL